MQLHRTLSSRICRVLVLIGCLALGASALGPAPAFAAQSRVTTTTITPGEDSHLLEVTTPGQQVRLSFRGKAGQIVTVETSNEPPASPLSKPATLSLVRPNGRSAGALTFSGSAFRAFPALDAAGTWSLVLTPDAKDTGAITVWVRWAAAPTKPLSVGKPAQVDLPTVGQTQVFTFTGVPGRRPVLTEITTNWTTPSGDPGRPVGIVVRPDGSQFGWFAPVTAGGTADLWNQLHRPGSGTDLIDVAGTWSYVVRGAYQETGGETFRLDYVRDQVLAAPLGVATTATVTQRGQNVRYTFSGKAGQRPVLDIRSREWSGQTGYPLADMTLYRPDGSSFEAMANWDIPPPPQAWFEYDALDTTGTWTLMLDPMDDLTGTQTMIFGLATDPAARPLKPGTSTSFATSTPGTNQDLTFRGVVGERPVITVQSSSWTSARSGGARASGHLQAALLAPSGGLPVTVELPANGTGVVEFPSGVTETGTWRLRLDPSTDSVGSIRFSVTMVTDLAGTLVGDQPVAVTLATPYQQARLGFVPPAWGPVTLDVRGSTLSDVAFAIVDAYGMTLGTGRLTAAGDSTVSLGYLLYDGDLTLVVDPAGTSTGSLTLTMKITA